MAELKTKPSNQSVSQFIAGIPDERRRKDSKQLLKMMKAITGAQPKMWGSSIVGFGNWRYTYATGRQGDWFQTGFSPRKQALTLYLMGGFSNQPDLMKKLGKCTTGKGCLYVKALDDVDLAVLTKLIKKSIEALPS
jgi:hypothetical protein